MIDSASPKCADSHRAIRTEKILKRQNNSRQHTQIRVVRTFYSASYAQTNESVQRFLSVFAVAPLVGA